MNFAATDQQHAITILIQDTEEEILAILSVALYLCQYQWIYGNIKCIFYHYDNDRFNIAAANQLQLIFNNTEL